MQILCCSASPGTSHAVDFISEISTSFPLFQVSASFLHWNLGAEIKEKEGFGERKGVWNGPKRSHMSLEQRQRGGSEVWELGKAGRSWTWPEMITVDKHQPKIKVDFQPDLASPRCKHTSCDCGLCQAVFAPNLDTMPLNGVCDQPWPVFQRRGRSPCPASSSEATTLMGAQPVVGSPWHFWVHFCYLLPFPSAGSPSCSSSKWLLLFILFAIYSRRLVCGLGFLLPYINHDVRKSCLAPSWGVDSRRECPPSHCFFLSQDMILILTHFLFRNNNQKRRENHGTMNENKCKKSFFTASFCKSMRSTNKS